MSTGFPLSSSGQALFFWFVVPRAIDQLSQATGNKRLKKLPSGSAVLHPALLVSRVLGHAVGLSPLVVLVSVTSLGLLLGGIYALLAIPLAAIVGTLVDVIVRGRDPAEEDVPAVIFSAQDKETV